MACGLVVCDSRLRTLRRSAPDDNLHLDGPAAEILLAGGIRTGLHRKLLRHAVRSQDVGNVRVVRIRGDANPSMNPDFGARLEYGPDLAAVDVLRRIGK